MTRGMIGLEESRRRAAALIADAKAEIYGFGDRALPLVVLADYVVGRVT